MEQELTRDDILELIELSEQGQKCICSSDYLRNLANKINYTLNVLNNLRFEIDNQNFVTQKSNHSHNQNDPFWSGQLMYKHRGSILPKFEDLGFLDNQNKEQALEVAKKCAEKFLQEMYDEKDIESWEVKVRPVFK